MYFIYFHTLWDESWLVLFTMDSYEIIQILKFVSFLMRSKILFIKHMYNMSTKIICILKIFMNLLKI